MGLSFSPSLFFVWFLLEYNGLILHHIPQTNSLYKHEEWVIPLKFMG
jgi:hypothetical protein